MKKIAYLSIFGVVLISGFVMSGYNVNAQEIPASIQVAELIGEENADLLEQSLSALSMVLLEAQSINDNNEELSTDYINKISIINSQLSEIEMSLYAINENVGQFALEYSNSSDIVVSDVAVDEGGIEGLTTNDIEKEKNLASISSVFKTKGFIAFIITLLVVIIFSVIWMFVRKRVDNASENKESNKGNVSVNPQVENNMQNRQEMNEISQNSNSQFNTQQQKIEQ